MNNLLIQNFTDYRFIRLLVFLFPICAVSVRHWVSSIFGLLIISSLYYLVSKRKSISLNLYKEEKNLVSILVLFFSVFLVSSLLNGWGKAGYDALGTELRFVLIIPFFLLVRQLDGLEKYLLAGCVLAALVGGVQGIYDVFYLNRPKAWGFYGHLFIGPVTVLMVALLIPAYRVLELRKNSRWWLSVIALLGVTSVILSTARSAYLALLVLGVLTIFYYVPGKRKVIILSAGVLLVIAGYYSSGSIQKRVDLINDEVAVYFDSLEKYPDDPSKYPGTSLGTRLEMWRSTQYFFRDAPWFGVGRFNYQAQAKKYFEDGMIGRAAASHSHPHNAFIAMLMEKGLFGLLALLLILYYPLYVFIKTRNASPDTAFAGIVLITAISIFSLTEASTFIKGNFVAIYLVYLSVFFTGHLREIHKTGALSISE